MMSTAAAYFVCREAFFVKDVIKSKLIVWSFFFLNKISLKKKTSELRGIEGEWIEREFPEQ